MNIHSQKKLRHDWPMISRRVFTFWIATLFASSANAVLQEDPSKKLGDTIALLKDPEWLSDFYNSMNAEQRKKFLWKLIENGITAENMRLTYSRWDVYTVLLNDNKTTQILRVMWIFSDSVKLFFPHPRDCKPHISIDKLIEGLKKFEWR